MNVHGVTTFLLSLVCLLLSPLSPIQILSVPVRQVNLSSLAFRFLKNRMSSYVFYFLVMKSWVQSLFGELRSCKVQPKKKKKVLILE